MGKSPAGGNRCNPRTLHKVAGRHGPRKGETIRKRGTRRGPIRNTPRHQPTASERTPVGAQRDRWTSGLHQEKSHPRDLKALRSPWRTKKENSQPAVLQSTKRENESPSAKFCNPKPTIYCESEGSSALGREDGPFKNHQQGGIRNALPDRNSSHDDRTPGIHLLQPSRRGNNPQQRRFRTHHPSPAGIHRAGSSTHRRGTSIHRAGSDIHRRRTSIHRAGSGTHRRRTSVHRARTGTRDPRGGNPRRRRLQRNQPGKQP